MNSRNSASAYQETTAVGATAVGQIIALYDAILRDLRQALAAVEAGQIEQRVNSSNHALVVIGELQGVLDFERGGEAARHLKSFYNITRAMTREASVGSSREKFLKLISMFARLRAAWSGIENSIAPCEPKDRLRISSRTQHAVPRAAGYAPESPEGSGNGRWKA